MSIELPEEESPQAYAELLQDAVAQAFELITTELEGERPDPFGPSLSGLGRCRKQLAYRYARTEPTDPELQLAGERRTANIGTAVHRILLPALVKVLGAASHEVQVLLSDGGWGIPGTLDVWWERAGMVVDVKTVGEHKLDRTLRLGPPYDHRMQVGGYAMARGARWVAWIYVDRSTGASVADVEPFDAEYRAQVTRRVWEVQELAENPDSAPRDEMGPGLSYMCDSCPWLRRCWGRTAKSGQPGAQASLARTDAEVEAALGKMVEHRDLESKHRNWKNFWREVATGGGRPEATYGRWRWWRGKPGMGLDRARIESDYEQRGEKVPMKEEAPRMYVRPVKP